VSATKKHGTHASASMSAACDASSSSIRDAPLTRRSWAAVSRPRQRSTRAQVLDPRAQHRLAGAGQRALEQPDSGVGGTGELQVDRRLKQPAGTRLVAGCETRGALERSRRRRAPSAHGRRALRARARQLRPRRPRPTPVSTAMRNGRFLARSGLSCGPCGQHFRPQESKDSRKRDQTRRGNRLRRHAGLLRGRSRCSGIASASKGTARARCASAEVSLVRMVRSAVSERRRAFQPHRYGPRAMGGRGIR
jgi:hypothetical protein